MNRMVEIDPTPAKISVNSLLFLPYLAIAVAGKLTMARKRKTSAAIILIPIITGLVSRRR